MFNLDVTQKCLIAECWCPVSDLDKIQQALRRGTECGRAAIPSILNIISAHQEPPTFNRTNKFTLGFQAIVDAYGVASYQEVNPGIFHDILFFNMHDHLWLNCRYQGLHVVSYHHLHINHFFFCYSQRSSECKM